MIKSNSIPKVVIIGGSGFVGKACINIFKKKNILILLNPSNQYFKQPLVVHFCDSTSGSAMHQSPLPEQFSET